MRCRLPGWEVNSCGFLKPLSALLFVNYFIMNFVAKEYDNYDQEYELRMQLAGANSARPQAAAARASMIRRPQFAH